MGLIVLLLLLLLIPTRLCHVDLMPLVGRIAHLRRVSGRIQRRKAIAGLLSMVITGRQAHGRIVAIIAFILLERGTKKNLFIVDPIFRI